MLRAIVSFLLILIVSSLKGQEAVWGKFFDSQKGGVSIETRTTSAGDVLLFGYYTGELPVGNEVLVPKYNDSGSYIIKMDPDGSIIWAIPVDGRGVVIENAVVDSNGDIIIEGRFWESIFFDGQEFMDHSSGDAKSSFVAKLSQTGEPKWIKTFSNSSYGNIAIDEIDHIYFLNVEITGFNGTASFLRKFDPVGNLIFENQFLSNNEAESYPRTLDVHNGEAIVGGTVYGSGTIFNSITYNGGWWGVYVAKFNNDGSLKWAINLGETHYNNPDISDIMIESDGGFFVSGGLPNNMLLAKYSASGALEWSKESLPQSFSSSYLCKSIDGNIFFAANFYDKAEVDGHTLTATPDSNTVGNAPNVVVIKFDPLGHVLALQQFKPHIINLVTGISAGIFDDFYISGYSDAPVLEVGAIQMTSPNDTWENSADGFLVKFNDASTINTNFEIVASDLCVHENGIFNVIANSNEIKDVTWNFGDPASGTLNQSTSISPKHSYNTSGLYKVKAIITDLDDRKTFASAIFEVHSPPNISLGEDFALCSEREKRIEFDANAEWSFEWNDGSNKNFNTIKQAGKYWVSVTDQYCSVSDTLNVTTITDPQFELSDHTLCPGEQQVVDLSKLNAAIQWNDGVTNSVREISNAGTYTVTASNSCGTNAQSFAITVVKPLHLSLTDETLCQGQSYSVDLSDIDATISWGDGDTAPTKSFESAGAYSVQVANQCEEKVFSFALRELEPLTVDLGEDKITCNTARQITFQVNQPGATYLWSNGSTQSSMTVQDIGIYWLEVSNKCETVRDSVEIKYIDPTEIVVPNIITPNGDARNEFFVVDERITGSSLIVFNRWGQNVYSTSSYNNDWNAENLETAVYYYSIPEYCLKGWVHVLRN